MLAYGCIADPDVNPIDDDGLAGGLIARGATDAPAVDGLVGGLVHSGVAAFRMDSRGVPGVVGGKPPVLLAEGGRFIKDRSPVNTLT